MLAQQYRLRHQRDIDRVFRRGANGSGAQLHLKALKNTGAASRLAVVVGKRVSKKAVVRNRIRRQVKGMLAPTLKTIVPSYDIVVYIRADISELSSGSLNTQLAQALKRAGVNPGSDKPSQNHV